MELYKRAAVILIFGILIVVNKGYAQNQRSIEKREQELIKKEEERKAEEAAAVKDGQKMHMSIQSKETKKRMKQSKKRAKKVNNNKQGSFFSRMRTR